LFLAIGVLCNNVMPRLTDPLALAAPATARLALVAVVSAGLWAAVAWALAR
jgi:hypothetical protein